jgi:hypothetical protein
MPNKQQNNVQNYKYNKKCKTNENYEIKKIENVT